MKSNYTPSEIIDMIGFYEKARVTGLSAGKMLQLVEECEDIIMALESFGYKNLGPIQKDILSRLKKIIPSPLENNKKGAK